MNRRTFLILLLLLGLGSSADACNFGKLAPPLNPQLQVNESGDLVIRVREPSERHWANAWVEWMPRLFRGSMGLSAMNRVYRRASARLAVSRKQAEADRSESEPFYSVLGEELGLEVEIDREKLSRIPKQGPLVIVANHPLSGVDGAAIAAEVSRIRPDLKVVMTGAFAGVPELQDNAIFANPMGGPDIEKVNRKAVVSSLRWLKDGNSLLIFPAGDAPYRPKGADEWVEKPWSESAARFIEGTDAHVLPIFVHGQPGKFFHYLKRDYQPIWSASVLMHEIRGQTKKPIRLEVGDVVDAKTFTTKGEDAEQKMNWLQDYVYSLGGDASPTRETP